MERAKRSGGLHKRSAEDWGSGLRARGGWPPSWSWGSALRAGTGPQWWVVDDGKAGRNQGGDFLPLNGLEEKGAIPLDQMDDR